MSKQLDELRACQKRFNDFLGSDFNPGINGFFGEFRFLSNFHLSPLTFGNSIYPSVEHAYQAAKAVDRAQREKIRLAATPAIAKKMGGKVDLREDWDDIKLDVMEALLRLKFQEPVLRQLLIDTHPLYLEETNWWKDTFWGVYNNNGENNLGKLLMKIREEYVINSK